MIEIHKSESGKFFVLIKTDSNNSVMYSEFFDSKELAIHHINAVASLFRIDASQPIKVMDYSKKKGKEIVL